MQRLGHLHHIPDDSFASQAVETSSMDDTVFKSHLTRCRTLYEMRCEGLFVLGLYYCPVSLLPGQYHFELARFDGQDWCFNGTAREESDVVKFSLIVDSLIVSTV